MKIPRALALLLTTMIVAAVLALAEYVEVTKLYLLPEPLATDRFGEAVAGNW